VPRALSLLPFGANLDDDLYPIANVDGDVAARHDPDLVPLRDTKLVPLGSEVGARRGPALTPPRDTKLVPLGSEVAAPAVQDVGVHRGREYSKMVLYNRLEDGAHKHYDTVKIFVDGQDVGAVEYGHSKRFSVLEGRHKIAVKSVDGTVIIAERDYDFVSNRVYPCIMMPGVNRLFFGLTLPRVNLRHLLHVGAAHVRSQTSHGVKIALVDPTTQTEHKLSDDAYATVPATATMLRVYANGESGDKESPLVLQAGNAYTIGVGKNAQQRVWMHVVEDENRTALPAAAATPPEAGRPDADDGVGYNFLKNRN
jgi:hypothetical protein